MKKVLVCALAALFLMATCLTAFATVSYETTTAYNSDGNIEVTTQATSDTNGEMVTYLAYTGDSATEESIVYIDQQTYYGEALTFSYVMDDEKLSTVTVKSGSSSANTATDMELGARKITVKAENQDDYVFYLPETVGTHAETTKITVPEGYSLANDTPAYVRNVEGTVTITDNAELINNTEITVTFKINAVPDAPVVIEEGSYGNSFTRYDENNEPKEEVLAVLGIVTTDATPAADVNACGIVLSLDLDAISADEITVDGEEIVEYKAFAKNSAGYFAIQLVNQNMDAEHIGLAQNDYYARVYAQNSIGERVYGPVITINGDSNN